MYTLYEEDCKLLTKLNILIPEKLPHAEEVHLGKVKLENNSYIDIYITLFPATFYRFIVWCKSSRKKYELSTGSGTLAEYYPLAEQIAHGMVGIKELPIPTVKELLEDK